MRLQRRFPPAASRGAHLFWASRRFISVSVAAVLVTATLVAIFARWTPQTRATPQAPAQPAYATTVSGTAYGADHTRMLSAATAAQWPQQQAIWCGVATVAAIAQYQQVTTATQQQVADYLSSDTAVSAWGTPAPATGYYGPAFKADISRDFGTDPRSLAAALTADINQPYHQAIVLATGYDASVALARDIVSSGQPVSVFVDHALHSVVVSAVFATSDPVANPGSITGFEVWDPAWNDPNTGIQSAEYEDVPLNTWLTSSLYWGQPYNVNTINGFTYDPDPAVGPYAFDTSTLPHQSHLWSGHYVYIRPDAAGSAMAGVSADWAENQSGELIKGWDNQIPSGYTGPTSLFEGLKVTLGETSPYALAFSARGSYDAAAAGSAPAAALAWTGTDTSHHLNTLISQDGLHYGSKLTLSDTSILNPAILVAPPAVAGGPNIVMIAWIGTDTGHSLNVMYDVYGQRLKLTLWHNSSALAPSLAWYQGQAWLAWTGTDAHHSLNIIALGPQGMTQGSQTILWTDPGASSSPQLIADTANNRMLLGWAQLTSKQYMVMASSDNSAWSQPATGQLNATSSSSPGLLAVLTPPAGAAPLYLAWTTPWGQLYLWRGSETQGWTEVQATQELSPYGTEMGYLGQSGERGDFVLAWSGTDSAHHLNVALIQM